MVPIAEDLIFVPRIYYNQIHAKFSWLRRSLGQRLKKMGMSSFSFHVFDIGYCFGAAGSFNGENKSVRARNENNDINKNYILESGVQEKTEISTCLLPQSETTDTNNILFEKPTSVSNIGLLYLLLTQTCKTRQFPFHQSSFALQTNPKYNKFRKTNKIK